MKKLKLISIISVFISIIILLSAEEQETKKSQSNNIVITNETIKNTPKMKYKMIPLDSIKYSTIEKMCQPLLSPKAIMTHEKGRNSVLVYDFPENITKIEQLIRQLDYSTPNIRIDIDYLESGYKKKDGLYVGFDKGDGYEGLTPVVIKNGKWVNKPKQVKIKPYSRRTLTSRNTSSFITTMSGKPANLWVGKTQIDPSWLNAAIAMKGLVIVSGPNNVIVAEIPNTDFQWAKVGAALQVLPTYKGNGFIDVEVYPYFSYIDGKGKKQALKVTSLSTNVTVKDGQRIPIGGVISGKQKEITDLFGPNFWRNKDGKTIGDMYLTATIVKHATPLKRNKRRNNIENPWKFR